MLRLSVKRPNNLFARYGGEEFVILLPDTDEAGAIAVGEDLCKKLRMRNVPHSGSEFSMVIISVGVAATNGRLSQPSPEKMLDQADQALYRVRANGRNRVESWNRLMHRQIYGMWVEGSEIPV
jgi:diguanylate cyclase (GGDEF)-like protein